MPAPQTRRPDYPEIRSIQTRWADNDIYAHVNNVAYYTYFDTLVNGFLIDAGVLDPAKSDIIGLVVETGCRYFAPVSFPMHLDGGLRVAEIGTSSVRYELGIFKKNEERPVAEGRFVHVYVDRIARRPAALPEDLRRALSALHR